MKFAIYTQATISRYVGDIEAETAEQAEELADEMFCEESGFTFCYACADQADGSSIDGEWKAYPEAQQDAGAAGEGTP